MKDKLIPIIANRYGGKSFHVKHKGTLNSMSTIVIVPSNPINKYIEDFGIEQGRINFAVPT